MKKTDSLRSKIRLLQKGGRGGAREAVGKFEESQKIFIKRMNKRYSKELTINGSCDLN